MKELGKIAEEIGDQFGGYDNFLKIYYTATPEKYDFLYLDLQSNPPLAYKNFEKVIAQGGQHKVVEGADLNMGGGEPDHGTLEGGKKGPKLSKAKKYRKI